MFGDSEGIEFCERKGVTMVFCLLLVGLNFWRWWFFQIPNSSLALVDLKMSLVMGGEHVHM